MSFATTNFLPLPLTDAHFEGGASVLVENPLHRNASAWAEITEFLIACELRSLRLARLPRREAARKGPACGMGPRSAALPVGNTGITSVLALTLI